MNDRFKFRVWDKRRNKFIESPEPTPMLQANGLLAYFKDAEYMNNYVIQFCTGLKDKNGKLIYEGDILQDIARHDKPLYIVKWNKSQAQFYIEMINPKKYELYAEWHMGRHDLDYEVIGNIYENKELLEEE